MADRSPLAHSPTIAVSQPQPIGEDSEPLAAGTKVGEYVIDRFIGAGAMGEVYGGKHPVIGKRVAIKILRAELAASAEAGERFIREARAVNQIEHENVVDVFAFGRLDDGRLYLVMDLVDGRSLRAHLIDGPLSVGRTIELLSTIADALDAAHSRGVVHRDLKPDNIVLSDATPPKIFVLDFGIARLISTASAGKPTGPGTLTGAGTWLGTPSYMAPEQWSVDGAGTASDRYALGVIAFELLSGVTPFTAASVPAMMEQHFRTAVPTLASRGGVELPSAIDGVLRKALAKDPDARFETSRAFVDALRAAAGTARAARAAVAVPAGPRKRWLPAIAGAGVLGVGAVVLVLARGDENPETTASAAASVAPAGSVTIDVMSTPSGAEIRRAGAALGVTPKQLFARPGEQLDLVLMKPGYTPANARIKAGPSGSVAQVTLAPVDRFEGTWRLENGELRHFERRGDEVDVFKLRELAGTREFYKTYRFGFIEHGVTFAAEDVVSDPYAPSEPSCNVRMRVEYHYDPMHDTLEQQRDKIALQYAGGKCIIESRTVVPTQLARVGGSATTREISAPMVGPVADNIGDMQAPISKSKTTSKKGQTVLPPDPKGDLMDKTVPRLKGTKPIKNAVTPSKTTPVDDRFEQNATPSKSTRQAPTSQSNVMQTPTTTDTSGANAPISNEGPMKQALDQQQVLPPPQPQGKSKD